eukprot:TRINITY_DN17716_c0_g1_i1.p1 TRINITY_DN17716_c0_g1~~TRINITY_DN17716_c0_g1_i1.p1  ORF type:complete len:405 (+),score=98.91 TRINITY_DN17716_c0_g1_i1:48-1217(+)
MHHEFQSEKGLKRKASDSSTSEFEIDNVKVKKNKHCRASKAKWTIEEDEALTRAVVVNGEGNWKKIAQSLNDRSHLQCLHRWQKVLNPSLVKGPWKEEEDNTLVELVEKYGAKDWSSIASNIPGRIGKQCRERWFNHLSPEVRKTNWSPEEDRIIIEAHHRLGNKWTAISKLLDGRPANAIKNHWNSTLLKRIQDETGEIPVRRERKKPKILRAVQATDDSDSESISSECSSPELSPRYTSPLILAPLPIPPQTHFMPTPAFLPQPTSDSAHVIHQLIPSPRVMHAPMLNSFAPFGESNWDWPASQQTTVLHVNVPIVASSPSVSACNTPIITETYAAFPLSHHSGLSYCIDQQASDVSSVDGLSSPEEVPHHGFFPTSGVEMPSLFTM